MEYSQTLKRARMTQVMYAIDGGNAPGSIELRDAERNILATLILTRPSFYLVGADLYLCAPTTGFVMIAGMATIGTITDGSGFVAIDDLSVGVDQTADGIHDFEIVLDDNSLQVGKQVTIVSAVIEHG